MRKSALLAAIQQEIHRHDFSHFVENPPTIAEGGKGIVRSGCPACKKPLSSMSQFLDHHSYDVLPPLINGLSTQRSTCEKPWRCFSSASRAVFLRAVERALREV